MRIGGFVLAAAAACAAHAQERDHAPFITTPDEVVAAMLRFAGTGPDDVVVDLGSGDGRIVIAAARDFGARGIGIELDPALVARAAENARRANVQDRASFRQGDVLLSDLSMASVVTIYLLPSLIDRLQPRLLDELQPGTRVVSHAFGMTGWRPDRTHAMRIARRHEGQGDQSTLYLWVVPAKLRGEWRGLAAGPGGAMEWRIRIMQNFQQIEVEAHEGGRRVPVSNATLAGRSVSWSAGGREFRARLEGEEIVGELAGADRASIRLARVR